MIIPRKIHELSMQSIYDNTYTDKHFPMKENPACDLFIIDIFDFFSDLLIYNSTQMFTHMALNEYFINYLNSRQCMWG